MYPMVLQATAFSISVASSSITIGKWQRKTTSWVGERLLCRNEISVEYACILSERKFSNTLAGTIDPKWMR